MARCGQPTGACEHPTRGNGKARRHFEGPSILEWVPARGYPHRQKWKSLEISSATTSSSSQAVKCRTGASEGRGQYNRHRGLAWPPHGDPIARVTRKHFRNVHMRERCVLGRSRGRRAKHVQSRLYFLTREKDGLFMSESRVQSPQKHMRYRHYLLGHFPTCTEWARSRSLMWRGRRYIIRCNSVPFLLSALTAYCAWDQAVVLRRV